MNKICGYSCEHNKGGVCQITNCDKKIMMTTTTEPQVLTRWKDPIIDDLKKEIDKLTAESTEWEERTYCWQDRAENLQIVLDKIKENTERTIEIIKQQPTEDDTCILERLNSNLKILEEIE